MSREKNMRESLLDAEPLSPERQQRLEQEVARILEPPLPRTHRLYYIMGLVGSVVGVIGTSFGVAFDAENRWMHAMVLMVWVASALWILHILRRGAEPLRVMQGMSKALAGLSVAAAGVLIAYGLRNPSLASILWAMMGLLFFLLVSFINLWNRVILAERTIREQMLRVEYRLAGLAGSREQ